ncbi:MAG: ATP synthase F0 subunit B [Deltaproteobacteria bacterium]|nr:ATP synthase F0 subunit B [Deltaproteobacteria bacterium]MBW2069378.1 ATP synthase F0 subunit B [Deltaproteobacteria bacterium]
MINIDVTLLIQMVSFLVFLFIMNVVLYRPVRRMMARRQELILSQKNEIDQANNEARKAVEEFEQTLRNARAMGRKKVEEYKEQARAAEKEMLQKAYQEAADEVARVREEIRGEKERALKELREQIELFSLEVVEKILGRKVA